MGIGNKVQSLSIKAWVTETVGQIWALREILEVTHVLLSKWNHEGKSGGDTCGICYFSTSVKGLRAVLGPQLAAGASSLKDHLDSGVL